MKQQTGVLDDCLTQPRILTRHLTPVRDRKDKIFLDMNDELKTIRS